MCSSDLLLPGVTFIPVITPLPGLSTNIGGGTSIQWTSIPSSYQLYPQGVGSNPSIDRKSVVQGKSVDLGGSRTIKTKIIRTNLSLSVFTATLTSNS